MTIFHVFLILICINLYHIFAFQIPLQLRTPVRCIALQKHTNSVVRREAVNRGIHKFRLHSLRTNYVSTLFRLESILMKPVVLGSILGTIVMVTAALNFKPFLSFGREILENYRTPFTSIGLYGRVPYDDYLFSTWRLTDPNILKRSLPEVVSKSCSLAVSIDISNIQLYLLRVL